MYYNLQKYPEGRKDLEKAAQIYQQQGNNAKYQLIMDSLDQLP